MMNKILYCLIFAFCGNALAKHIPAESPNDFDRLIKKYAQAVVLFHTNDQSGKKYLQIMHDTSDKSRYVKEQVAFIDVDITKAGLAATANEYGMHKLPVFVLFKNGALVKTPNQRTAVLRSANSMFDLREFIDSFFFADSDDDIQEPVQKKRRIVRASKKYYYSPPTYYYSPYYYGYPYYSGYGYPYYGGYGYGGYYGGSGVGVSVGFGF